MADRGSRRSTARHPARPCIWAYVRKRVLGAPGDVDTEARPTRRRRRAPGHAAEVERGAGRRQGEMLVSVHAAAALAPDPGLRQWQLVGS